MVMNLVEDMCIVLKIKRAHRGLFDQQNILIYSSAENRGLLIYC